MILFRFQAVRGLQKGAEGVKVHRVDRAVPRLHHPAAVGIGGIIQGDGALRRGDLGGEGRRIEAVGRRVRPGDLAAHIAAEGGEQAVDLCLVQLRRRVPGQTPDRPVGAAVGTCVGTAALAAAVSCAVSSDCIAASVTDKDVPSAARTPAGPARDRAAAMVTHKHFVRYLFFIFKRCSLLSMNIPLLP